ncbi:flagellin [Thalassolituus sp. LLYu03]|uniref:flagellin N-terminal helical domain-containing protein n=1 Tax=Thalassolituus sp. LLYu03 TaxID=3421656 RepID=UPI003D286CE9
MSLSINSSTVGTSPSVSNQQNRLFQQISSASRVNSAADDAAGLAIATQMDAQLSGDRVAMRNTADGISYAQTASGALDSVTSNLQRMRELAVQAGNGAYNDSDRAALQKEYSALADDTQNILKTSSFNGQSLFSNSNALNFQVGADAGDQISIDGNDLAGALADSGVFGASVASQSGAADALAVLDDSLQQVSGRQAEFGAAISRFESSIDSTQIQSENTASARSRIMDTDFATATSELTKEQIKNQAQIAVQAQANGNAQQILRLLGG